MEYLGGRFLSLGARLAVSESWSAFFVLGKSASVAACVCVCVCVYVCMLNMHACVRVCVHAYIHSHVYMPTDIPYTLCMHACKCVFTYLTPCVCMHASVCLHIDVHTNTYIYAVTYLKQNVCKNPRSIITCQIFFYVT